MSLLRRLFSPALLAAGLCASGILQAQTLSSTNLPIIIITSSGAITGSQSQATMKLINNGSGNNTVTDAPQYQSIIGIETRGNAGIPKPNYTVETWANPFTSDDTSLLGMPSENDWVLLGAYHDRSLMRTLLAYRLWESLGYYAPRARLCEVIIDNDYKGVYLFGENIKRDDGRLDIANLQSDDISGVELTGGYILTIDDNNQDGFVSPYAPAFATAAYQTTFFHYNEPDDNDINNPQKNYIKNYVDSFEDALMATNFQDTSLGWRLYGAENWFEDYLLMSEVTGNHEAYRKNTYLYKDKNKKLRVGPPWNQDQNLWATADCMAATDTAWMWRHGLYCPTDTFLPPFWWARLQEDTTYLKEVQCKYTSYRAAGGLLDTTLLFARMDSISTLLISGNAQERNFIKYPVFGVPLNNEPTPMAPNYYGEVLNMKAYLARRLAFLDSKWLRADCQSSSSVAGSTAQKPFISLSPNPGDGRATLAYTSATATAVDITVLNLQGQLVRHMQAQAQPGANRFAIDLGQAASGVYAVRVSAGGTSTMLKMVVR